MAYSIHKKYHFDTRSERDLYFRTNPYELVVDRYCVLNNTLLQQYNGNTWVNRSTVVKDQQRSTKSIFVYKEIPTTSKSVDYDFDWSKQRDKTKTAFIFDTLTDRDLYFSDPYKLKNDMKCIIRNNLYQWNGNAWVYRGTAVYDESSDINGQKYYNDVSAEFLDISSRRAPLISDEDIHRWNEKEDSLNKITEWNEIPNDDNYPSEKLVRESLIDISENVAVKIDNVTLKTNELNQLYVDKIDGGTF
jgi:hypothetical protein